MSIETEFTASEPAQLQPRTDLLQIGMEDLSSFQEKADVLRDALEELAQIGDTATAAAANRLQKSLENFEPSVTMIGQVKAGKTSLVNAMVGWPDLLPADVNPWTSVVTSLHLSPRVGPNTNGAKFKFFDENEWARLLEKGGRIGELASRAGAVEELETVRLQIEAMREKSRSRLGKRFEMLLGQEHEYGYFDQELIERYVCLGDDFDSDEDGTDPVAENQGRFADISKSADLFLHRPEFKTNLCIRDTPGVNDTFMMREQITIRAIRGSRLCVVVLSAHQALSSVDMALIRLISNIRSREVIIFVNRIDELSDPVRQVPEIRDSIQRTLKENEGPSDAQIIFGSAYWANNALSSSLEQMSMDSADALVNWAEQDDTMAQEADCSSETIWRLSGVPALYRAISERIAEGAGQEAIDKVARGAINLANGMHTTNQVVELKFDNSASVPMDSEDICALLDDIQHRYVGLLNSEFASITEQFQGRIDRSHRSFLTRATASLISHLERYGEDAVWQYDPTGLRMLLRSSHRVFGAKMQKTTRNVLDSVSAELMTIYGQAFGQSGADINIETPDPPRIPPPVFLGQTIALDMQGSWWKGWWQRRRGYKAFAAGFFKMIMEETDPIVNEMKFSQSDVIRAEAGAVLLEFLLDQRQILMNVVKHADATSEELRELLGQNGNEDRKKVVENTLTTLNRYVA